MKYKKSVILCLSNLPIHIFIPHSTDFWGKNYYKYHTDPFFSRKSRKY